MKREIEERKGDIKRKCEKKGEKKKERRRGGEVEKDRIKLF